MDNNVKNLDIKTDTPEKKLYNLEIGKVQNKIDPNNIDLNKYEQKLNEILEKSQTQREKVTNSAIFLATIFPKIPYLLDRTSGHDGASLKGLNWVKDIVDTYDKTTDSHHTKNRTLDCSGFVSWTWVNSGLTIPITEATEKSRGSIGCTWDYENLIGKENEEPITSKNIIKNTKPGDFAYMKGHIGIIIEVNKKTSELVIAHSSENSQGMGITTISTITGKVTKDDARTCETDRIGKTYFETVLHPSYKDDEIYEKLMIQK